MGWLQWHFGGQQGEFSLGGQTATPSMTDIQHLKPHGLSYDVSQHFLLSGVPKFLDSDRRMSSFLASLGFRESLMYLNAVMNLETNDCIADPRNRRLFVFPTNKSELIPFTKNLQFISSGQCWWKAKGEELRTGLPQQRQYLQRAEYKTTL